MTISKEKRDEQMMNAAEAYAAGAYADEPVSFSTEEAKAETIADFCAGWHAADRCSHWIPVEEELPEPHFADTSSDWVLVCTTKGGVFIDSYNHKHNEWLNNRKSVTHWMPKPLPPRNEE